MQSSNKPSSSSPEWSSVSSGILVGLILIAAVTVCFYPLSESEFLLWDEESLLVQNREYQNLSTDALTWMFSTFFYGHYQPLAWVSFALDFLFWGLNAPGFRWTSIALHALNALLVYGIALRLMKFATDEDRSRYLEAGAAALFFAVHPLRAEPVAWLANRNGLLATLFVLLCLTVYLDLHRPGVVRRAPRQLLSLFFFALALLSKASVMTFPAVLVILDLYPRRRSSTRSATTPTRARALNR